MGLADYQEELEHRDAMNKGYTAKERNYKDKHYFTALGMLMDGLITINKKRRKREQDESEVST